MPSSVPQNYGLQRFAQHASHGSGEANTAVWHQGLAKDGIEPEHQNEQRHADSHTSTLSDESPWSHFFSG